MAAAAARSDARTLRSLPSTIERTWSLHRTIAARDLVRVDAAIVDAGHAALASALMVQYLLDNMRLDSDVAHAARDCAPDVVNDPCFGKIELGVQLPFV